MLESKETIKLNVNSMVRLPDPIKFDVVRSRKQQAPVATAERSSTRLQGKGKPEAPPPKQPVREKPQLLGEPKHNEILASLADHRL